MKIHCSGIGGIGLSAYASLRNAAGDAVSGTDRSGTALTDDLARQGITFSTDQSGAQIPAGCELLVYSEAMPATAPERVRAAELGIPQQSYPQALGDLSRGSRVIAVCGTHGKSSTTGMAARLLLECGLDPTIVVGTKLQELQGRNWRAGKSDLFLLEACEYRRSFSFYAPRIILLTNCDGDHFDYYKDMGDYHRAFTDFARSLPADGTLITHLQDSDCASIAEAAGRPTTDADAYPLIELGTPGKHMQENAQLVLALGDVLGIDPARARAAVGGYAGSWRRLESKGIAANGALVIDDYAHHPREIRASLAALRGAYPGRRLVCVFQPHTHDRTLKLYDNFTTAFRDADLLLVADVYEARKDIETARVDLPALVRAIAAASHVEAVEGGSLQRIEERLSSLLQPTDVVACLGAGDVTNLAAKLAVK